MIAITGATGNIGSKLSTNLLERGQKIRVIGRSSEKLQPYAEKGAETAVSDLTDADSLTEAFRGARAVFALIPADYTAENYRVYYNEIGSSTAAAIEKSDVTHVVNLSSVGAHLSEGVGPVKGLYDQEQRLNKLDGVHVLHLRPTYFMENLLANIDMIKNLNMNAGAIRGDIKFSMIATQDIADVAAEELVNLSFQGKKVRELHGERDLSLQEATRILGEKIGKPDLRYTQLPFDEMKKALLKMGVSEDFSNQLIEMSEAMNKGIMGGPKERTPENTTKTSFEQFAEFFAQVYRGAGHGL